MLEKYYPYAYAGSVFDIDYVKLYACGYRAILFDIDNTLVHHGADATPEVEALFREIHGIGLKTLLLSNNDEERVQRFIRNIDTPYLCDADKPDPAAYQKAAEMLGVSKKEAIVIGDQIFTDILGANRCGMPSILVHYIMIPGVTKIGKKRYLEKAVLSMYQRSKYRNRLGNILK